VADLHSLTEQLNRLEDRRRSLAREVRALPLTASYQKVRALKRELADLVSKIERLERRLK